MVPLPPHFFGMQQAQTILILGSGAVLGVQDTGVSGPCQELRMWVLLSPPWQMTKNSRRG